jgi:hypothetical protein
MREKTERAEKTADRTADQGADEDQYADNVVWHTELQSAEIVLERTYGTCSDGTGT